MANSFNFVGRIIKPKDDAYYASKSYPSGWTKNSVRFSVVSGNNVHTVVVEGGKWEENSKNIIKTYSVPVPGSQRGEPIEFAWNERLNADIISQVAPYKRFTVDLTPPNSSDSCSIKKEFIHPYDYVEFLKGFLKSDYVGKNVFKIGGNIEYNYGSDKDVYYRNFCASYITLVEDTAEQYSEGRLDLYYYGKNAIENGDEKSVFNAYVKYYDRIAKANMFAPMPIALYNDEESVSGLKKFVGVYSKDAVYGCPMRVEFVNGSPMVDTANVAPEDLNLSEKQKKMIEYGLTTIAEIIKEMNKAGGSVISGNRVTETKFLKLTSTDGVSDTAYTLDDLKKKPAASDSRNTFVREEKTTTAASTTSSSAAFDPIPFDI